MTVLAIILMCIGGYLAAMNAACFVLPLFTKKHSSMVPPLGGIFLVVGFALHPTTRPHAYVGLLVDVGFWAMLIAIPHLFREWLDSAPWRRVSILTGEWSNITFTLSLYRPDYFVVQLTRELPPGVCGWTATGSCGSWRSESGKIVLTDNIGLKAPLSQSSLVPTDADGTYQVTESNVSSEDEMPPSFPPSGTLLRPPRQLKHSGTGTAR